MKARPYQSAAIDGIFASWQKSASTLAVLPTGTGKTIIFATVIKNRPAGRAMVVAHREELIYQAADKIESVTGVRPDIEMADLKAGDSLLHRADVVVSSIQTQNAGKRRRVKSAPPLGEPGEPEYEEVGVERMTKFDPMQFSLLIVDEAHHATAKTYRRVIDHFRKNPSLKVLGVTATPDRGDEEALGQIFETVAYDYALIDAIHDGWLVPIRQRCVHVTGLDLTKVRTTAGDLNNGQLSKVMVSLEGTDEPLEGADLSNVLDYEAPLHGIAGPTIELIGDRKTLVFAASVAHAERLCEIFNRHKPGSARFVCGETPKDERQQTFADYAVKAFQILVNVGVATEGFDDPGIEVVVMARPTKSRALYAQMAGRGTRPLAGIVDNIDEDSEDGLAYTAAELRRMAIAASAKPFVEIIDFVGNAGRHKLMTTADILGGNFSEAAVEKAKSAVRAAGKSGGAPVDMVDALADAEKRLKEAREAAARAALKVKATYQTTTSDPFDLLGIEPWQERGWDRGRPPTDAQLAWLEKRNVKRDSVKTFGRASQLIDELIHRRQENRCTVNQARILAKNSKPTNVTFEQATALITEIAKVQGWGKPAPVKQLSPPPPTVEVY
jgi:superfamily II DNA or RNA helicase